MEWNGTRTVAWPRKLARAGNRTATVHGTFRIERIYRQSVARVFRAFTEKSMVRRWRVESEGCEVHEFTYDFRIGGSEVSRFSFAGGPEIRLDAWTLRCLGQRNCWAWRRSWPLYPKPFGNGRMRASCLMRAQQRCRFWRLETQPSNCASRLLLSHWCWSAIGPGGTARAAASLFKQAAEAGVDSC
jgi:hypothetical protein